MGEERQRLTEYTLAIDRLKENMQAITGQIPTEDRVKDDEGEWIDQNLAPGEERIALSIVSIIDDAVYLRDLLTAGFDSGGFDDDDVISFKLEDSTERRQLVIQMTFADTEFLFLEPFTFNQLYDHIEEEFKDAVEFPETIHG